MLTKTRFFAWQEVCKHKNTLRKFRIFTKSKVHCNAPLWVTFFFIRRKTAANDTHRSFEKVERKKLKIKQDWHTLHISRHLWENAKIAVSVVSLHLTLSQLRQPLLQSAHLIEHWWWERSCGTVLPKKPKKIRWQKLWHVIFAVWHAKFCATVNKTIWGIWFQDGNAAVGREGDALMRIFSFSLSLNLSTHYSQLNHSPPPHHQTFFITPSPPCREVTNQLGSKKPTG